MRILVVDDDTAKLGKVFEAILAVPGINREEIFEARDAAGAKRALRERRFDLLILDMALPETADKLPSSGGGIALIREIERRGGRFNVPQHIVGLTAYEDVYQAAVTAFSGDMWTVLRFDLGDDSWRHAIQRRVRHIQLTLDNPGAIPDFQRDLAIVTALPTPELRAVLDLPWRWESTFLANDGTEYHEGTFIAGGASRRVVAAVAPRMGMAAAAALCSKMIEIFRPRYLAMTGITAGMRGRCNLGDPIAIDPSWDWGSGKWGYRDGSPVFLPAPHQLGLTSILRGKLGSLMRDTAVLAEIQAGFRDGSDRPTLRLHMGPVASGAAVLANSAVLAEVESQHRKLLGVEMEAYGVYAAASESSLPQPSAFVLKSVSDFADVEKGDLGQWYAAYTSAQTLRVFAEGHLF
jgi:nucleoside phosphorylase